MWKSFSRKKSYHAQKKKENERKNIKIHIKRAPAQVQILSKKQLGRNIRPQVIHTRVFLNDFSPSEVEVFSPTPVEIGTEVAFVLEEPKPFFVKGRILWTLEIFEKSPILKPVQYNYRIAIAFAISSEKEEKTIQKYWEYLQKEHVCLVFTKTSLDENLEEKNDSEIETPSPEETALKKEAS